MGTPRESAHSHQSTTPAFHYSTSRPSACPIHSSPFVCIRGSSVFNSKFKDLHFVVAEEGGLEVVADEVDCEVRIPAYFQHANCISTFTQG